MSAMIPFFSSCSDDDSVNEWDMSYVSLLPADYLRPTPSFTLKHVEEEGKCATDQRQRLDIHLYDRSRKFGIKLCRRNRNE